MTLELLPFILGTRSKKLKRKGNLYKEICKIENITKVFEEVCRNTKNKRKVGKYRRIKKKLNKRFYMYNNNLKELDFLFSAVFYCFESIKKNAISLESLIIQKKYINS